MRIATDNRGGKDENEEFGVTAIGIAISAQRLVQFGGALKNLNGRSALVSCSQHKGGRWQSSNGGGILRLYRTGHAQLV